MPGGGAAAARRSSGTDPPGAAALGGALVEVLQVAHVEADQGDAGEFALVIFQPPAIGQDGGAGAAAQDGRPDVASGPFFQGQEIVPIADAEAAGARVVAGGEPGHPLCIVERKGAKFGYPVQCPAQPQPIAVLAVEDFQAVLSEDLLQLVQHQVGGGGDRKGGVSG